MFLLCVGIQKSGAVPRRARGAPFSRQLFSHRPDKRLNGNVGAHTFPNGQRFWARARHIASQIKAFAYTRTHIEVERTKFASAAFTQIHRSKHFPTPSERLSRERDNKAPVRVFVLLSQGQVGGWNAIRAGINSKVGDILYHSGGCHKICAYVRGKITKRSWHIVSLFVGRFVPLETALGEIDANYGAQRHIRGWES